MSLPRRHSSQLVLLSAFRLTWDRFRYEWRTLPRRAIRHWLLILVIGLLISASLSAGLTLLVRRNVQGSGTVQDWDARTLLWMAQSGPVSYSNAILLESPGNLSYLVPLTVACAVVAARRGRPLLALTFLLTYTLQRLPVLLGWQLWNRARPDLIADGIAAPGLHSFPSGHAALTFSLYGLLTWLWIRASGSTIERILALLLFLSLVAAVGWSRVVLSTHWPSDVLAGWAVGLAWVVAVILAVRRAEAEGGK